ncbi:MAG TPA: hypothetical protein VJS64_10775 [Pyrinomonadaceae bacterium]|nr:hypothetical protein [Pyrinomonadaceae bacterium]
MRIFRSRFGIILAALYLTVAAVVTYQVYGCTREGFLPCDLPLGLVILPATPLLLLLDYIGVREPSLASPGPYVLDLSLILLSVLFCAAVAYLIGAGLELGYRFVTKRGKN